MTAMEILLPPMMTRTLSTRVDIPLLQQSEFLFQRETIEFVLACAAETQRQIGSMEIITT
jgi:hypothetical protein